MKPLLTPSDLSTLSQLLTDAIPCINRGGCCVAASMIAPLLDRHFPTKIRVMGGYREETEGVDLNTVHKAVSSNSTNEWNSKGVRFFHVVTEFTHRKRTYQLDSDRLHLCGEELMYPQFALYKGDLSFQAAIELADDWSGWNRAFNRDNIPKMHQIIHDFFKGFRAPRKRSTKQLPTELTANLELS